MELFRRTCTTRHQLKKLNLPSKIKDIKLETSPTYRVGLLKYPYLFYIDLEPNSNNKSVFEIRHINNAIVSIVPPKKYNDLLQCHRCQNFGHTKAIAKGKLIVLNADSGILLLNVRNQRKLLPDALTAYRITQLVIKIVQYTGKL